MFCSLKRKTLLILILSNISVIVLIYYFLRKSSAEAIQCYHHKFLSLPSILDAKPAKGKSIFFHETSCNSDKSGKISINSRQACAVESAAKLNPNFEVYLLYVSPGIIKYEETESDRFIQALQSYKNVKILHLDFGQYIENSPVENLWFEGTIERSDYVVSHASDVLRYLSLWKYGGIYLDLDVIVIKPLENLPLNYAGAQSDSLVAAGVLSFQPTGSGHLLAGDCLKDLRDNFDGHAWGRNGPDVVTNLAKKLCASETVEDLINKTCFGDFRVYPMEAFYPVEWENWTMFFNEEDVNEVEMRSKDSYVIHMWNKLSADVRIPIGAQVSYSLFAEEFCPKVYKECREFF